jgi:hypothetical protein
VLAYVAGGIAAVGAVLLALLLARRDRAAAQAHSGEETLSRGGTPVPALEHACANQVASG